MRTELKNSPMSLANTRMLVVITETDQQSAILKKLEAWQVTAYVASSCYEALGMSAHEAPFDVAIISHPLANMDSGKLAQSLREHNGELSLLRLSESALPAEATATWPNTEGTTLSLVGPITSERLQQSLQQCIYSSETLSLGTTAFEPTPTAVVQSASPASEVESLINRQMLEATAESLGGLTRTWLEPFLDLYSQQSTQLLQQIRVACQTQDSNALSYAAHTLKSSSAALGLMQISQCCHQLEQCGRTQQIQSADRILSQLEAIFEPSFKALERLTYSLPL